MVVLVVVKEKKIELVWCGVCGRYARHVGHVRFRWVQKRGLRGQASQLGGWKKGHWLRVLGLGSNP